MVRLPSNLSDVDVEKIKINVLLGLQEDIGIRARTLCQKIGVSFCYEEMLEQAADNFQKLIDDRVDNEDDAALWEILDALRLLSKKVYEVLRNGSQAVS